MSYTLDFFALEHNLQDKIPSRRSLQAMEMNQRVGIGEKSDLSEQIESQGLSLSPRLTPGPSWAQTGTASLRGLMNNQHEEWLWKS